MGLVTLLTNPDSFKFYANGDPYKRDMGKGNAYDLRAVPYRAGTPGDAGIAGNGSNPKPLITTPLPSLDSQQTPQTLVDGLYRGQGVLSKSVFQDTERISKFLITEQGLQFIAKQQALLLTQNIQQYGSDVRRYQFINPGSYVANTALAPTGEHVRNTFTFGLNPSFTRESTYGEMPTYEFVNKKTGKIEEHLMSVSSYDQFKLDNPHLERYFSEAPLFSYSGVGDFAGKKTDNTWKEVMHKIAEKNPTRKRDASIIGISITTE